MSSAAAAGVTRQVMQFPVGTSPFGSPEAASCIRPDAEVVVFSVLIRDYFTPGASGWGDFDTSTPERRRMYGLMQLFLELPWAMPGGGLRSDPTYPHTVRCIEEVLSSDRQSVLAYRLWMFNNTVTEPEPEPEPEEEEDEGDSAEEAEGAGDEQGGGRARRRARKRRKTNVRARTVRTWGGALTHLVSASALEGKKRGQRPYGRRRGGGGGGDGGDSIHTTWRHIKSFEAYGRLCVEYTGDDSLITTYDASTFINPTAEDNSMNPINVFSVARALGAVPGANVAQVDAGNYGLYRGHVGPVPPTFPYPESTFRVLQGTWHADRLRRFYFPGYTPPMWTLCPDAEDRSLDTTSLDDFESAYRKTRNELDAPSTAFHDLRVRNAKLLTKIKQIRNHQEYVLARGAYQASAWKDFAKIWFSENPDVTEPVRNIIRWGNARITDGKHFGRKRKPFDGSLSIFAHMIIRIIHAQEYLDFTQTTHEEFLRVWFGNMTTYQYALDMPYHVALFGKAATGKSRIYDMLKKKAVPRTVFLAGHQTAQVLSTQGIHSDQIKVFNEAPPAMMGMGKYRNDPQVSRTKDAMVYGRVNTVTFRQNEDGQRLCDTIYNECRQTINICTNGDAAEFSGPMRSRMALLPLSRQVRPGKSIIDLETSIVPPAIQKLRQEEVDDRRCQQYMLCLVEKLIMCLVIGTNHEEEADDPTSSAGVNLDVANTVFNKVLTYLRTERGLNTDAPRSLMRARMMARTLTVAHAVECVLNAPAANPARPFNISFVRELETHLFCTEEIAMFSASMHEVEYVGRDEERILKQIATYFDKPDYPIVAMGFDKVSGKVKRDEDRRYLLLRGRKPRLVCEKISNSFCYPVPPDSEVHLILNKYSKRTMETTDSDGRTELCPLVRVEQDGIHILREFIEKYKPGGAMNVQHASEGDHRVEQQRVPESVEEAIRAGDWEDIERINTNDVPYSLMEQAILEGYCTSQTRERRILMCRSDPLYASRWPHLLHVIDLKRNAVPLYVANPTHIDPGSMTVLMSSGTDLDVGGGGGTHTLPAYQIDSDIERFFFAQFLADIGRGDDYDGRALPEYVDLREIKHREYEKISYPNTIAEGLFKKCVSERVRTQKRRLQDRGANAAGDAGASSFSIDSGDTTSDVEVPELRRPKFWRDGVGASKWRRPERPSLRLGGAGGEIYVTQTQTQTQTQEPMVVEWGVDYAAAPVSIP